MVRIKDIDFTEVMLKVQLMNDGKVIDEKKRLTKGWKAAKKKGAKMLRESDVETAYVRIYDPDDVTDIDFITRDRMKTRVYSIEDFEEAENERKSGK